MGRHRPGEAAFERRQRESARGRVRNGVQVDRGAGDSMMALYRHEEAATMATLPVSPRSRTEYNRPCLSFRDGRYDYVAAVRRRVLLRSSAVVQIPWLHEERMLVVDALKLFAQ